MNVVTPALGSLNIPKKPHFKGQELFRGKIMHTAEWDTSYNVKNRNVAVIGVGGSGIQIISTIAHQVKQPNSKSFVLSHYTITGLQRLYVEQYRLIQTICGGAGVTDVTDITDITDIADITDITDVMDIMDVTDIADITLRTLWTLKENVGVRDVTDIIGRYGHYGRYRHYGRCGRYGRCRSYGHYGYYGRYCPT